MSKNRIRKNRAIKQKGAAGAILALSMVGVFGIARASAGKPDGAEMPTPIQAEVISGITKATQLDAHILEETGSGTDGTIEIAAGQQGTRYYTDVPFVMLPVPMSEGDQEAVFRICQDGEVAFPLVMAIIEHESEFDASERSKTGDSGLMQINDINKASLYDLGYQDLFLLEDNVSAGVYMLSDLFGKYPGDTTFVLMAYNAGEKGAREMRNAGIYETEYSVEILQRAQQFTDYIDDALEN